MKVDVKVPEAGESISEGVIVEWFKEDGAHVEVDEPLFDLETDKVTLTVQATAAGRLEIRVAADQKVSIGQIVAVIDTEAAAAPKGRVAQGASGDDDAEGVAAAEAEQTVPAPTAPSPGAEPAPREEPAAAPQRSAPPLSQPAGLPQAREKLAARNEERLKDLSPAVRRLVAENDVDPAAIQGTGRDGRLTKEDVLGWLEQRGESAPAAPAAPARAAAPPKERAAAAPAESELPVPLVARQAAPEKRQTRRPMSPLRHRIAERLVEAQQTAAILTTFNEADMSNVLALRERWKEPFEKRYGARLGIMSFFVKAVVDALRFVPQLNAQIEGDEIVYNHYYDIGVAVGTDKGLVVPVVRDADRLTFAEVEKAIAELAKKARDRKLTLADLTGGVFTVSNGGVYGSLLSTPILNPPQSGILGLHATKKRPIVVPDGSGGDTIAIRPMMYLAMSYDHRLIDGKEAVTFLKRIVECIEHPERMMLEV